MKDLILPIKNNVNDLLESLDSQGFNVTIPEENIYKQFSDYLLLLEKWNKVYDLVSPGNANSFIFPHIIDSLASILLLESLSLVPSFSDFNDSDVYADIGSGAGLPGVIWHLLYKDNLPSILLEPRMKRCNFLKEVKKNLNLSNLSVINGKTPDLVDCHKNITSSTLRALKPSQEVLSPLKNISNLKIFWITGPNAKLDKTIDSPDLWTEALSYSLNILGEHKRKIYMRILFEVSEKSRDT